MTKEYDQYFQLWGSTYFLGLVSWPWFKAVGLVESNLNPNAISQVGARGIMQLMPETSKDMAKELMIIPDVHDPQTSIHFGIRYLKKMWDIFKNEEGIERLRFAFGAYNAGPKNIIDAQGLTDRPNMWDAVSSQLVNITGLDNSWQTINYVKKIERVRLEMIAI